MTGEVKPSAFGEIRNLLIVIFGAIVIASLGAGFMLYYYGPTGRYYAQNVLISPFYTSHLSFTDANPQTGRQEKFAFEGIAFTYYDSSQKKWLHNEISNENYMEFYNLVADDRSLPDISEEVKTSFYKQNPATLSFKVHPENMPASPKVFLEVNFVNEGDYYRVQLRNASGATGAWAYFYHPGVYRTMMQIFAKKR